MQHHQQIHDTQMADQQAENDQTLAKMKPKPTNGKAQ
jgi:hypothetical protein